MATTDEILFGTSTLEVGRFHCPPDDERWRHENWIGVDHHVVFPLRPVVIQQAGHRPVVANANHAVLYNDHQTYRRQPLSADGDLATFVVLDRALVGELLGLPPDQPPLFRTVDAPLSAEALLRIQLLVRAIVERTTDTLGVEETVIDVVGSVLRTVVAERPAPSRPRRSATVAARADLVEDTKRVLSQGYADRATLSDIARSVGSSPYHLARVFRAWTSYSLHGYREQLRLRHALERLTDPHPEVDLARLATDLGFASHGHFDVRFRLAFGRSPSSIRALPEGSASRKRVLRPMIEVAGLLPASRCGGRPAGRVDAGARTATLREMADFASRRDQPCAEPEDLLLD
jgi:AraC family transcriptional regulator